MSNEITPDEETTRLIKELDEQAAAEQTAAFAPMKGKPGRKPKTAPVKPVAPVAPEPVAPVDIITNTAHRPMRLNTRINLAPGESYTLVDLDRGDERLMAKINHMVKLGVFTRGTH